MDAVNGESAWWTKSSRSLDTRPLRAFIIKSIRSSIICISATMWGGAVSVTDERLVPSHSCLLGALLPSSLSWFLLFALVPSWSSSWVFSVAFLWRTYSSWSWFCLVRCSTIVASLDLPLEGSDMRFISLSIVDDCHWVSKYHATLCLGSDSMACKLSFLQTVPTDDAENRQ